LDNALAFGLFGLDAWFAGWWRENCELLVGLDAQLVMAAACYGV